MGFFSNLSGGQQRSDIRRSTAQANSMIDQGFNESQGYYDQAAGLYDPYTQQGGKAATMYADLLGINGGDARSEAQGVLTSDPLFQGGLAQDSNALLKQLNARGQSGGGRQVSARGAGGSGRCGSGGGGSGFGARLCAAAFAGAWHSGF